MKISISKILILMLILILCAGVSNGQSKHKYLGVKMCSMCHKGEKNSNVYEKWQNSPHAKAYQTLLTPQSDKIAKDKGLKTTAKDSKECLECHATAYGVDPSSISEKGKLDITDGVQCEDCHGAGADYMPIHGKDKAKGMENGLIISKDEKSCTKCHNKKSPTFKVFNYKEALAKIAHPINKTK